MRCALLIGFEYKKYKKLPGILVDLYQVYSFVKNIGWKDKEIYVFTDIEKDEHTNILKTSILEKIVDSNILSFIKDIKGKNQYISFKENDHYNNFNSIFLRFTKYDNLFMYYSGHSKDEYFVLPNQSLISIKTLLKSKQIFIVMDCCEGGLKLPFVLNEKIYRLENENFIKPQIICIASSLNNQKSTITKSGSNFTRYLFNTINHSNLNMQEILEKVNKNLKETANITVSYPNLYYIFTWFYQDIKMDIIYHRNFIQIN